MKKFPETFVQSFTLPDENQSLEILILNLEQQQTLLQEQFEQLQQSDDPETEGVTRKKETRTSLRYLANMLTALRALYEEKPTITIGQLRTILTHDGLSLAHHHIFDKVRGFLNVAALRELFQIDEVNTETFTDIDSFIAYIRQVKDTPGMTLSELVAIKDTAIWPNGSPEEIKKAGKEKRFIGTVINQIIRLMMSQKVQNDIATVRKMYRESRHLFVKPNIITTPDAIRLLEAIVSDNQ